MENKSPIKTYLIISFGFVVGSVLCVLISSVLFPDLVNLSNFNLSNLGKSTQNLSTPSPINQVTEAQDVKLKTDLKSIQIALEQYFVEYGSYPEDLSILVKEGFANNITINTAILEYEKTSQESYQLSVSLSDGEKHSVTPED